MPTAHELDAFNAWLQDTKSLQGKSARDVVSRLRRLYSMSGNAKKLDIATSERIFSSDYFSELSVFVRSQLKRSATLYFEFKKQ